MASDVGAISNHCNRASVCGWKVNMLKPTNNGIGTEALERTSTGSPVSRLFWHILASGGTPGNCHVGAGLLMNGSSKASAISWESAVTSWKPLPNNPGDIQLAKSVIQRGCGTALV